MVLDLRRSCSSDQDLGWQIYSLVQVNDKPNKTLSYGVRGSSLIACSTYK
jgi:hypothetical protein